MQTTDKKLTSLQMLKAMSSKLGKSLGVGGSASFAVLKKDQTPADLALEYAMEEVARLDAIAKTRKDPVGVDRAARQLKRIIDMAVAAEERLVKANQLATMQRYTHPDQIQTKEVSARGAGPLAKTGDATATATPAAEPQKSGLDAALEGLAELTGEELDPADETTPSAEELVAAELGDQEEVETAEEIVDAAAQVTEGAGGDQPAEKRAYPIGEDGVPVDGAVSWGTDIAKEASRERKGQPKNGERLAKAVKEGDVATIAEAREKAKRRESTLERA